MVTGVIEGSKYIQYTLYKILKDSLSHMYVCMYVSNMHVYIFKNILDKESKKNFHYA